MRSESPPLAPFLRSSTQARLLAELLLHPQDSRSVTELARILAAPQSVVSAEVTRLVEAGVLADERIGRTRLVRANQEYRLYDPLTEILAATFGPEPVLTRLLAPVRDIEAAYLYGSWAARAQGVRGREPGDVDVLVIGTPAREDLNAVTADAERALGIEVQITRFSAKAWQQATEPFIKTVQSSPHIQLDLKETAT